MSYVGNFVPSVDNLKQLRADISRMAAIETKVRNRRNTFRFCIRGAPWPVLERKATVNAIFLGTSVAGLVTWLCDQDEIYIGLEDGTGISILDLLRFGKNANLQWIQRAR